MMAPHELEHRSGLEPLADRWGMHPEQRARLIAVRRAPTAIALANPASGAQPANDFILDLRNEPGERGSDAREPRGALVTKAEGGAHGSLVVRRGRRQRPAG